MNSKLTILEGSTFCICDELGDVTGYTDGLFAEDTRFLSRLQLTINGARPLLLSSALPEVAAARGIAPRWMELGFLLVCSADFDTAAGFGPGIRLTRTQTIMQGASHCDFRYRRLKEAD